jgi:hypothetical protein
VANALANSPMLSFERSQIEAALLSAGVNGQRRGETLSLDELAAICRALFAAPHA